MKKIVIIIGTLASVFLFSRIVLAVEFPAPVGYVNDFAGILASQDKTELEVLLKSFETQTSNEIVVAIVPSFEGFDPFSYSQELFTAWKLGQEGRNNGVLMVIGPREGLPFPERGEVFINVGKGLEGALPDSLAGSIIRHEMVPMFQEKNSPEGVRRGLFAIMQATKGEYTPVQEFSSFSGAWNVLVVMLFVFINYIGSFLARSKSWWLGGVLGGIGGFALGLLFFVDFVLIFALGLGGIGLVLDYLLSKNYEARRRAGKPTDFWHSGGGFWFGGGGRGHGGGFGGFGGGISGGGGAGGRW